MEYYGVLIIDKISISKIKGILDSIESNLKYRWHNVVSKFVNCKGGYIAEYRLEI